jgi:polyphenol oxidase
VTVYQVHSADAVIISTPPPRDALPRADAVISNKPGLAIGVLTADCGPVLMADPDAGVVAAVHAGWRGAVGGVLASALAEMERLGADRHRIVAAIGPCISQSAYEVGDDFTTAVTRADPESAAFLAVPNGKVKNHFDLPGYIEAKLRELNINRIDNVAACTHGNESLFFSYRRATQRQEPDYGRQISAIVVA